MTGTDGAAGYRDALAETNEALLDARTLAAILRHFAG